MADSVRYVDDTKFKLRTKTNNLDSFENDLALNSIKITKELTPELQIAINQVCENLNLDPKKINAYINHSLEINAGCINDSVDKCIITLTSPLVNMLTIDELNFTIGHELGHFLLNHCIEDWINDESQESLIKRRAQEISCDRIGLIACRNFDVSIKSMVKSLSGLSGKYLTYDMRSFLNQLDNINPESHSSGQFSTHPAFLLRVKALLRFSVSDKYLAIKTGTQNDGAPISEVDNLIQKDLNKYVDNRIRGDIEISKENILFWGYISVFVSDAKFTKNGSGWAAQPTNSKAQEMKISVSGVLNGKRKNFDGGTFRILPPPPGKGSVTGLGQVIENAGQINKDLLLNGRVKGAKPKDFLYDYEIIVTGFDVKVGNLPQKTVKGSKVSANNQAASDVKSSSRGTVIVFSNIKASSKDGDVVTPNYAVEDFIVIVK